MGTRIRWALLVVACAALLGGSTVAQVYVPPMAVDRLTVYVSQFVAQFNQWGPRLTRALTYVAAIATGVLTGRLLEFRDVTASGASRELLESGAEAIADAVGEQGVVWVPEEAVVIESARSIRPEIRGVDGYWNKRLGDVLRYNYGGIGRASTYAGARDMAWASYHEKVAQVLPLEEWLLELARAAGFWLPDVGEYETQWGTYYYEVPEALRTPPTRLGSFYVDPLIVEVPAPGVEIDLGRTWTGDGYQYTVAVVPRYMYLNLSCSG